MSLENEKIRLALICDESNLCESQMNYLYYNAFIYRYLKCYDRKHNDGYSFVTFKFNLHFFRNIDSYNQNYWKIYLNDNELIAF